MESARKRRIVPAMARRKRRPLLATVTAIVIAVTGCALGDSPPPAGVRPDGFPTGVFEKTYEDPDFGPMRLSWVFDANGDWAEVPEATNGQTIQTGPARGHYTVDGDLLSISLDFPPFWSDTRHRWRLEGDRLVTTFEHSDDPADAEFFAMLERQPWVRVP
jgi:hypothetical protein